MLLRLNLNYCVQSTAGSHGGSTHVTVRCEHHHQEVARCTTSRRVFCGLLWFAMSESYTSACSLEQRRQPEHQEKAGSHRDGSRLLILRSSDSGIRSVTVRWNIPPAPAANRNPIATSDTRRRNGLAAVSRSVPDRSCSDRPCRSRTRGRTSASRSMRCRSGRSRHEAWNRFRATPKVGTS